MVLRIGHRGAMGHEPENTLLSFKKALSLGVDMIELDVHTCASREVVVIHDAKVDRTTNGRGKVANKALKELRVLDAEKGERVPTLIEVLDLVKRKAKVNIELKGKDTAKPVLDIILEYVSKKGWKYDDFLITSFDHRELEKLRKLSADVKIGLLYYRMPRGFGKLAEKINAHTLNPRIGHFTKKHVDDAHRRGMKVYVYTVNDAKDIEKMKAIGVDGIISNYPDRI